jgi:hypothetical protein
MFTISEDKTEQGCLFCGAYDFPRKQNGGIQEDVLNYFRSNRVRFEADENANQKVIKDFYDKCGLWLL